VGRGETLARLSAICSEVGFEIDSLAPSLLARLELLAEFSETVSDCERMAGMARAVFAHHARTDAFSEAERRVVVLGCLLSDVGKTGPTSASPDEQRLVTEMFAVERVLDDQQSVGHFLTTYFPGDAAQRVKRCEALGVDSNISIRSFWNLHSGWTLEILDAADAPPEAIAAAATHHLLDNINPDAIVAADGTFTRPFGDNLAFDRAEKLIIVLDKYDALRRRGRQTHQQAIDWLRKRLDASPRFHADVEFSSLISSLEVVLQGE
jgi:hypothetical protein